MTTANKLAVSLKDPKTGVETSAQEITNAPNGDYIVIRGALSAKDPNGNEWTAESLTNLQHKLVAQTAQSTSTTVRSSGHTIEFWSSPIANDVFFAPSDNMEFSNDPDNPIENVIGWDYDDSLDQKEQTGWRIRIFPDFVVKQPTFDPNSNPYYVFEQSGADDANQITISKSDGFISGERYWAYVQVSKAFQGTQWLGDWTAKPFNVIIEQPQPAIISVQVDPDNATANLIIQSTDNLFNDDNGDFDTNLGGWNVATNDTAGTTIDIGVTGGPLGATLVAGQATSVVPFGATGYVSNGTGITATQAANTKFQVSATNGHVTSPLGFPTSGNFWILVDTEKILVTNGVDGKTATQPDNFIIVQRGYLGTTAAAHNQWATITYGTQDDIYVGSVGTLYWNEVVTETIKKAVPGRPKSGPFPITVTDTHDFAVVSIPKGADNSKKTFLWINDPEDLMRSNTGTGIFKHAVSKATNPTKKAKSVTVETHLTITHVSNAPTTKQAPILLGRVSKAVTGQQSVPAPTALEIHLSQDASNAVPSSTGPRGGPAYPTLPAGTEVELQYSDPSGLSSVTLVLSSPMKLSNGGETTMSFKARGSFNSFHDLGLSPAGALMAPAGYFAIPVGTDVYYQPPPKGNSIKKLTLSQPLASYPAVGDTLQMTYKYTHTGRTPAVKAIPAKTAKKRIIAQQDFLVAETLSATGNNSVIFTGCLLGNWNGTVFTPGPTSTYNAVQISGPDVVAPNQYTGFGIVGLGLALGETIAANTASTAGTGGNTFIASLTGLAVPAYGIATPGVLGTQIYSITATLLLPNTNVIPAGTQAIPVASFVPKAKFPRGSTVMHISYPPYYGSHSMIVKTTAVGNSEITIQDPNWSSWDTSNSATITPGITYGFAAWGKTLTGSIPNLNLYIDWFDALNNLIATSDGTQSLNNPTVNNGIGTVPLGASSGTMDWVPNGIVAVAPRSATMFSGANYYTTITGGAPLTATQTDSNELLLNSLAGVTINAGDTLFVGTGNTAEEVQVLAISGLYLFLATNLLYSHTNDLVSNGVGYTLGSPTTVNLAANTTLVTGSGATVVTSAPVAAGSFLIPVQFIDGGPITTADTLGVSAAYACPRIELSGTSIGGIYGISSPYFKALTAHDTSSSYVAINSELPMLSYPVYALQARSAPDATFVIPEGTPTEGAGTIYIFDPTNDYGEREVHMGSGDPVLDTTLAAKVQAGSNKLVVKSAKGLARGQTIVLNVYASLPANASTVTNVMSALYQSSLSTSEANVTLDAKSTVAPAPNFTNTKGVVNDKTEAVIIDAFWDGSHNVTLQSPVKNAYPAGTQVSAFVTGVDRNFFQTHNQGSPVAVMNWNKSGYLDSPGTQYYFVVESSNDYGKTWTTLYGGDNLVPDASGAASLTDYSVIPNHKTYYRATGNFIDKDADKTVTQGAPSPPSLSPIIHSDSWWISSTSDQTVRFPILVQNGVQETQKHPVGVNYPLGSSRPYTTAGVVQGRDATIEVVWTDNARWTDFLALLNKGETLLLLDPVEGERRYIFISDDVKVTHNAAANPWRTVSITYVEAAPPGFGFTYGSK